MDNSFPQFMPFQCSLAASPSLDPCPQNQQHLWAPADITNTYPSQIVNLEVTKVNAIRLFFKALHQNMETAAAAIAFAQAAQAIIEIAKGLSAIPDDYRLFVQELYDISNLALYLDKVVENYEFDSTKGFYELRRDLEDVVQSLHQLSADVKRQSRVKVKPFGDSPNNGSDRVSTFRWERKKSEIERLRQTMRRIRDNLSLYLQLANLIHLSVSPDNSSSSC